MAKLGSPPAPFIAPVSGTIEERLSLMASAISRKADQTTVPVYSSIGLIGSDGAVHLVSIGSAAGAPAVLESNNETTGIPYSPGSDVTLASLMLTPGDWDVSGHVEIQFVGVAIGTAIEAWANIGLTNSVWNLGIIPSNYRVGATTTPYATVALGTYRFNVAANTQVNLNATSTWESLTPPSSATAFWRFFARRAPLPIPLTIETVS